MTPRRPLQLLQSVYRGPIQRQKGVCQTHTANYRRTPQDCGPQLSLHLARPSDTFRSPTYAGLPQDGALVAPAQGW